MNPETVLAGIVAGVREILKEIVAHAQAQAAPPTLYDLEAQTQGALARIGYVILQPLVSGQGAGMVGPSRPCACGGPTTLP